MKNLTLVSEVRECAAAWRRRGESVALVPTMGNLHAGHLSLVARARDAARRCVASVFVNPLQFGPEEDYGSYPRSLEADRAALQAAGCDALFAPSVEELFPAGAEAGVRIDVPGLSQILCGARRPGHFSGVATVVMKLFNIVQPDVAVFGEKDFQQVIVIRRLVADLCLPVTVLTGSTAREPDGLALSSRNHYLTPEQRAIAPRLYATLQEVAARLLSGDTDYVAIERNGLAALEERGFRPDYLEIREAADVAPPRPDSNDLVVLAAAWLGRARLIDNVRLTR